MHIEISLVWRQWVIHLQVDNNLKVLVNMVTWKIHVNRNISTLIKCFRDLKNMNWQVESSHTWRERNTSTNWLAKINLTLNSFYLYVVETSPRKFWSLIFIIFLTALSCFRVINLIFNFIYFLLGFALFYIL
jgi:hypothetical protein